MTALAQRSFAGGEISPAEYGRVDLVKYATGLATLKNWIIQRHGGAKNRPGTTHITEVQDSSKKHRQFPYNRDNETTFNLLFGDLTMRAIKNGVQLNEATQAATATDNGNPIEITIVGHTFVPGDQVFSDGFLGITQLNGRNFLIGNTTANTVELKFLNGTNVDASGFGTYVSGGTLAKVFEIVTPYSETDLPTLSISQSIDVVTITTNNHPPQDLTRISDTNWTIADTPFVPELAFPTAFAGTKGGAGSKTFRYRVTALDPEDLKTESLPALQATQVITNASQTSPVRITVTGHNFESGNVVEINNIVGPVVLNGRRFIADVFDVNNFDLRDEDGTGNPAYGSAGDVAREEVVLTSAADPSLANPHNLTWTAVASVEKYIVYKEQNGVFGFIGEAVGTTFDDTNITPVTSDTHPSFRNPFFGSDSWPAISGYHQQRRMFGRLPKDTELVEGSRTGKFSNFTRRSPLQDDDALRFRSAGQKVNGIRAIVDLNGQLVILTQNAEMTVNGNVSGVLTPTEVNPVGQTYNGASELQPIVVNGTLLYVQGRQSIVRDLRSEFEINGYKGDDLTVHSAHLFDNFTIVAWAYQQIPHSIVWLVRDDGTMLGLTYIREQQMLAWHRHELEGGFVEDVITIPEGNEDVPYMIVRRQINITGGGVETVRYVERMNSHKIINIKDWIFLDSSKTLDGRNTNTSHTMTISGGPTWTEEDQLTLTSNLSFFDGAIVGDQIQIEGTFDFTHPDTQKVLKRPITIRMEIEEITTDFVVKARPDATVPASLQNVATSDWAHAVKIISGLWHIEGQKVSIFADANVVASVNNKHYEDTFTVLNGQITLDVPYAVVHVGLPITSDIETLDMDSVQGETLADKKKLLTNVTLFMEQSRGIWVGPKEPPDFENDPLEGLEEFIIGDLEKIDKPVPLTTGTKDVSLSGRYTRDGRVFIRQVDPLPASVLAVVPRGKIPLRG